jgi:hypothetical protein
MPHYNNVIDNLNRKLFLKFNKIKLEPQEGDGKKDVTVETYLNQAFNQHYGVTTSSNSSFIDVPDVSAVDDTYETHRPTHIKPDHDLKVRPQENPEEDEKRDLKNSPVSIDLSDVREQGEELAPDPSVPTEPEVPPAEMGEEPDMGGVDPGMGGMGVDPGMGDPNAGMPGMEEPKSPTELGRTYEMKKIYSRLVAMNQYLADEMSPKIYKTKQSIARAIDLFAVIGANPESYTDRIDEIIVGYYKFLEVAYKIVKSYYKSEAKKGGDATLEKNEEQKDDKGDKKMEVKI